MIRVEETADSVPLRTLYLRAFGDEGPQTADLVDGLREHPCGRDGVSYVADVDGLLAGHVMVTRNRLDTLVRLVDVGVLSPLAVDPDHQRRGLGRDLVARAVSAADELGLPALFLEGDPAYYSRLGFVAAKPLGFRKPSIRTPDAAFQVMTLSSYEPWMTGTLVYAEPFWDLDCVGLRDPRFLQWLAGEVAEGREL